MFKYKNTKVVGFDAAHVDRDHVVNDNIRRKYGCQV